MHRTILILTDGIFFYGGYSTNALKIHNMLKSTFTTKIFSFAFQSQKLPESHADKYIILNYDAKMEAIETNITEIAKYIVEIINLKFNLVLCTSPMAFYLASHAFTDIPIVYVKGGLIDQSANFLIQNTITKTLFPVDKTTYFYEKSAARVCNKYYTLPQTRMLFDKIIKSNHVLNNDKLLRPLEYAYFDACNNTSYHKKYDVIFVVSNHQRIIKNSSFALKIFTELPSLKKLVIGANSILYKGIVNTKIINETIELKKLYAYFSKSKTILSTSFYDTGPLTIIEAIQNGCVPIVYNHCGYANNEIGCIVMDNLDLDSWYQKINFILNHYELIDIANISDNMNKLIIKDIKHFNELCNDIMCL